MKRTLLFCSFLILSHLIFAQYWTASGNNIYNSLPGYVGIGTGPSYPLDVAGTIHTTGCLLTTTTAANSTGVWIQGSASGNANMLLQANAGGGVAFALTAAPQLFMIGGSTSKGAINIDYNSNVAIGTTNTTSGYLFAVAGSAVFDQVTVQVFSGNNPSASPWADYVFDKNYQLPSLYSLADYIKMNKHLPGIPTNEDVKKNGVDLGATQAKLLEKIEQLTLYTIQLQQQVDSLKAINNKFAILQQEIDELKQSARQ
jgi:hypothetical protein